MLLCEFQLSGETTESSHYSAVTVTLKKKKNQQNISWGDFYSKWGFGEVSSTETITENFISLKQLVTHLGVDFWLAVEASVSRIRISGFNTRLGLLTPALMLFRLQWFCSCSVERCSRCSLSLSSSPFLIHIYINCIYTYNFYKNLKVQLRHQPPILECLGSIPGSGSEFHHSGSQQVRAQGTGLGPPLGETWMGFWVPSVSTSQLQKSRAFRKWTSG